MERGITRRDFLNGVALAIGAAAAPRIALGGEAPYYPPALTGLRGSHAGSFENAHRLRDGGFARFPDVAIDEEYDLVVVGAGISGLAAAHLFRKALGSEQRVLLLDNHDDFGGHAKRNEFSHGGKLRLGYGGTMSITTPFPYSYAARALIDELGVPVARYRDYVDESVYAGLASGMFFDRETFGTERLVHGYGSRAWPEFLADAPLSARARADLVRLYTVRRDYLPGIGAEEKRARLARMSYQDFLVKVAGVTPDALPFFRSRVLRNAMHIDTAPALHAAQHGMPGLEAMGLEFEHGFDEDSYTFHFPDGNATIARLLVDRLVPGVFPAQQTAESIVLARAEYSRLDNADSAVRIRLNSTVVRVEHEGDPSRARSLRVAYMRGSETRAVRAHHVVLGCYNAAIPFLTPELPEGQKQALRKPVKVPLMYTNVFLRNWKAWKQLGIQDFHAPGLYHSQGMLDFPVSIGGYACAKSAAEPIVVHLVRYPTAPGLPRREQHLAGRRELLATPFATIERETRSQLARILGGGGFDPARDILAITANRWPHGYAYTPDTLGDAELPFEEQAHVIGRRPFGRIAIANSDAEAAAFTNTAIDAAHRAVQDLLRARGMV